MTRRLGAILLCAAGGAVGLSQLVQPLAVVLWIFAGAMLGLATWVLARAAGAETDADPDIRSSGSHTGR